MSGIYPKGLFQVVFLLLTTISVYGQSTADTIVSDRQTACSTIYFGINKSEVDVNYKNNTAQLDKLHEVFAGILRSKAMRVSNITISVSSSPDGDYTKNLDLAQRRTIAIKEYILNQFPEIKNKTIQTIFRVENWAAVSKLVENDKQMPNRIKVITILNKEASDSIKIAEIRSLQNGGIFNYMASNLLSDFRNANLCLSWNKITINSQPQPPPTLEPILIAPSSPLAPASPIPTTLTLITPSTPTIPLADSVPQIIEPKEIAVANTPKALLIKSNAALLLAGVTNIGLEMPIGNHFSIDVPLVYSPYKISRPYRIEALMLQPELRYWLTQALQGHFFGVHLHGGWFTVATNNKARYQDKDGDTPLWGAGLSYGYKMPISERWGLEFTIGAGYANIEYDTFHNVHNGAKYATDTKNYWGITRAGINLTYLINLK